jgi:purine nucleosidase
VKKLLFVVGACLALAGPVAAQPIRLIFDTDMGNDIDDAVALAMIHAAESRGEAKLLAVTVTKDNRWAAPFIDAMNTFYGRPDIPIGTVHDGKTPENADMIRIPATRKRPDGSLVFLRRLTDGREAPEAVGLLRRFCPRRKMAR